MYGLVSWDQLGPAPAYKPTSVLTNHPALAGVLQEQCHGGHRHAQLVGKHACTKAAVYPRGLCEAIVTGVQIVKAARAEALAPSENLLCEFELEDMCEQDPASWEHIACQKWEEFQSDQGCTRDSTTGEVLDPKKVEEGCQEEMGFMSQMHVWNRVTREEALRDPEGKIVGTRWVFAKK